MRTWIRCCVVALLCCIYFTSTAVASRAASQNSEWYSKDAKSGVVLNVDIFMSSTCPHCHKAEDFFTAIMANISWLKLNKHLINEDKSQLLLFSEKLQQFHSFDFSVPTMMFCGSRWVGFGEPETTGKMLLKALTFCHQKIEQDGQLTEVTQNTLKQWSATGRTDLTLKVDPSISILERLMISGLAEAFTPCSLFCTMLLFAVFWSFPDSRRQRFYMGLMFILLLGGMHTWQFVLTHAYQYWMMNLRLMTIPAAVMLMTYLVRQRGDNPLSSYWMTPLMLLVIPTVYAYQQTCEFNIGILFQQWLQMQTMTSAAYYFCELTYLFFYLIPLCVVWLFYLIFNVHPRQHLPIAANLIFVSIAVLLLAYPSALASRAISAIVFISALFVSWYYVRMRKI